MINIIEDNQSSFSMKGGRAYPADFTGIYILKSNDGVPILKRFLKNGVIHRLDGPGDITKGMNDFYIEGLRIPPSEFWNHPKVVEYKLNTIKSL